MAKSPYNINYEILTIYILGYDNINNNTSVIYSQIGAIHNNPEDGSTLFTVVYDENGKVKDFVYQNIKTQNEEIDIKVKCNIVAKDTIKMFLWDSLDSMKPMCSTQEIKVI